MTDHFAATEPFGAAGTIFQPSDDEVIRPDTETIRDRLWTNISRFIGHDLDRSSQAMLSDIVHDARDILSDVNAEAAYLVTIHSGWTIHS